VITHGFETKMLAGLVHEGLATAAVGEPIIAAATRSRSSASGSRTPGGRLSKGAVLAEPASGRRRASALSGATPAARPARAAAAEREVLMAGDKRSPSFARGSRLWGQVELECQRRAVIARSKPSAVAGDLRHRPTKPRCKGHNNGAQWPLFLPCWKQQGCSHVA
jgi:hypothetical protein